VSLTLAACLKGTRRPSLQRSAIVPGVLAGLAAGSKYTAGLALLPVLLAIALYLPRSRRLWGGLVAIASTVAAFLAVVPYSVIDFPTFLNGVAFELSHYARGHPGSEAPPGLPQLAFYARLCVSEFGFAGAALAVLGACVFVRADWRRGLVLLSFPAALLWVLASHRAQFARNVLGLYPVVAICVAQGILSARDAAAALAAGRGWSPRRASRLAMLVGGVVVAIAVPFWRLPVQMSDHTDSRTRALAWIEAHVPPTWTVAVPPQLRVDTRALKARGVRVEVVDLRSARDDGAFQRVIGAIQEPAIIMIPTWAAVPQLPGEEAPEALNAVARRLRVLQTFGENAVFVNAPPVPWGDPAFAVATTGRDPMVTP
jgi:hypothetical protein